ncbi:hypothetical protein EN766_35135, partial [Mesorhizobium sp. M2A.F.Ca.ET.046.02.1.1]
MDGYRGILPVDGYAAYNRLARSNRGNDGVMLAVCCRTCGARSTNCMRQARRRWRRWPPCGPPRRPCQVARIAARQAKSTAVLPASLRCGKRSCRSVRKIEARRGDPLCTRRRAALERFLT